MKKASNILQNRVLTLVLIALWLLLSVANIMFTPNATDASMNFTEASEEKQDADESKVTLKVTEAVQSTVSINLSFQSFLLDEITLEDDEDEHVPSAEPFFNAVQKRIKILLRRIISPNAP